MRNGAICFPFNRIIEDESLQREARAAPLAWLPDEKKSHDHGSSKPMLPAR